MFGYTRILIVVLALLAVVSGYNYLFHPFASWTNIDATQMNQNSVSPSPSPEPVDPLVELIEKLSPEQKIAQLISLPLTLPTVSSNSANLTKPLDDQQIGLLTLLRPGFVLIYGEKINFDQVSAAIEQINQVFSQTEFKPAIMVDHEGGSVQRLGGEGFTRLPSWRSYCQLPLGEREELLAESARELSSAGINIVLAPVLDVATQSSVLKDRVCSGDPMQVAQAGAEFVRIFQSYQILPVLKHYPGIGSITKDLHTSFDTRAVKENDLLVFDLILDKYSRLGVMSGHMGTAPLNPDIPCSLSPDCLNILSTTHPRTLVFSDDLLMESARYNATSQKYDKLLGQVVQEAVKAGNQVLIFGKNAEPEEIIEVQTALMELYNQEEGAALIDTRLKAVFEYKNLQSSEEQTNAD
ncbi:MAG TPA: glycoside hydrolase family 3 N-terminal domain-containing protein [Candidatus Woesebacteria bacterium]|mgnify:CR=1 FL=1|nr:glycoside hydrolase family 3 N-terminal domain-containing protein [Candidatus Woesebacteria bacterium]